MEDIIKLLEKDYNITPDTKYHNYSYLYKSMLEVIDRVKKESKPINDETKKY